MAARVAFLLIASVSFIGCGSDSWIIVRVAVTCSANPCAIPGQVDALGLRVTDPDGSRELGQYQYELDAGHSFPIEIVLQPSDGTPERLRQEMTATLQGIAQTRRSVVHPWSDGEVNLVRIDATIPQ